MAQSTKRETQHSAVSDEDNPKSRLTSLGGSNLRRLQQRRDESRAERHLVAGPVRSPKNRAAA